jgi:hypothetical protein
LIPTAACSELDAFVLGGRGRQLAPKASEVLFLKAMSAQADAIHDKIHDLQQRLVVIDLAAKKLNESSTLEWLTTIGLSGIYADSTPRIGENISDLEHLLLIAERDRHYDLDLRLYPDRREVARKAIRNAIRELTRDELESRPATLARFRSLGASVSADLLDIAELVHWARVLADRAARLSGRDEGPGEWACFAQLAADLADAVSRPRTAQDCRTTSCFLFWTIEEFLWRIGRTKAGLDQNPLAAAALQILRHYFAVVRLHDVHRAPAGYRSVKELQGEIREYLKLAPMRKDPNGIG